MAKVTRPLFSGYIFARFTPAELAIVLLTRGVVQALGMVMGKPEPIDEHVIESLRRIAAAPSGASPCAYVVGESVTVARGAFAGVSGIVSRVKDGATLTIPIQILGRAVSVQIDARDLQP